MSNLQKFLIGVFLIGAMAFAFEFVTGRKVAAERNRLGDRYGRLEIDDPSMFYVIRVPTDDPMDFAWRCYAPQGTDFSEYHSMGRYGGRHMESSEQAPGMFFKRIRYLPVDEGLRKDSFGASHTISGIEIGGARKELATFLIKHWNELDFTVLGNDGQVELDPDTDIINFLTIGIPEHLQEEASRLSGDNQYNDLSAATLLKVEFGVGTLFGQQERN